MPKENWAFEQVSFGLLNSTRIASRFAWTDFRLSANYQPVKWIGVAVNYGVGTFGDSFGWIVNIAPKGFLLKVCVPLVDAVMVLLQLMKPISVNARPKVKSLPNLYVAPRSNATPYPEGAEQLICSLS